MYCCVFVQQMLLSNATCRGDLDLRALDHQSNAEIPPAIPIPTPPGFLGEGFSRLCNRTNHIDGLKSYQYNGLTERISCVIVTGSAK